MIEIGDLIVLAAAAIGGLLAMAGGFFQIRMRQNARRDADREQLAKLAALLRKEVEATRKLLEERLSITDESSPWDGVDAALPSLLANSHVFQAYLDRILQFPTDTALRIAQFHGELRLVRLQFLDRRASNDAQAWEKLRTEMIAQARDLEDRLGRTPAAAPAGAPE